MNGQHDDQASRGANDALDQIASLTAALATAEEALQHHAVHLEDCAIAVNARHFCTCGASIAEDALAKIEKARGKV